MVILVSLDEFASVSACAPASEGMRLLLDALRRERKSSMTRATESAGKRAGETPSQGNTTGRPQIVAACVAFVLEGLDHDVGGGAMK